MTAPHGKDVGEQVCLSVMLLAIKERGDLQWHVIDL